MHGSNIGRAWTKHDLGGSRRRLGSASFLHTAYLPIEMSKSPRLTWQPAADLAYPARRLMLTVLANPGHRAHQGLPEPPPQGDWIFGRLAAGSSRTKQSAKSNGTQAGGVVERLLSLVDTPHFSEQGVIAVTPAPKFRSSEGIPPLGLTHS